MSKRLCKSFAQQSQSITPAVYASLAIALVEGGFTDEMVADVFARSQQIWEDNKGDLITMLCRCYNETGIQVMSKSQYKEAVKRGLIDNERIRGV